MVDTNGVIFFFIKQITTNQHWHVYDLEGVSEDLTYGFSLFIKKDMEIDDEVVKDNAIGFLRTGSLSDTWLQVLCAKYDLPIVEAPMKEQLVVEVSYLTQGNTKTATGDIFLNAKVGPDYLNLADLIIEVFPAKSMVAMYIPNPVDAQKVVDCFLN
ncbi:MAG: hypothetical protein U0V74_04680 [Chitinophagales bacterium]